LLLRNGRVTRIRLYANQQSKRSKPLNIEKEEEKL